MSSADTKKMNDLKSYTNDVRKSLDKGGFSAFPNLERVIDNLLDYIDRLEDGAKAAQRAADFPHHRCEECGNLNHCRDSTQHCKCGEIDWEDDDE